MLIVNGASGNLVVNDLLNGELYLYADSYGGLRHPKGNLMVNEVVKSHEVPGSNLMGDNDTSDSFHVS